MGFAVLFASGFWFWFFPFLLMTSTQDPPSATLPPLWPCADLLSPTSCLRAFTSCTMSASKDFVLSSSACAVTTGAGWGPALLAKSLSLSTASCCCFRAPLAWLKAVKASASAVCTGFATFLASLTVSRAEFSLQHTLSNHSFSVFSDASSISRRRSSNISVSYSFVWIVWALL